MTSYRCWFINFLTSFRVYAKKKRLFNALFEQPPSRFSPARLLRTSQLLAARHLFFRIILFFFFWLASAFPVLTPDPSPEP
jgi:hypothetical protein